jgi:hypothetical protein
VKLVDLRGGAEPASTKKQHIRHFLATTVGEARALVQTSQTLFKKRRHWH